MLQDAEVGVFRTLADGSGFLSVNRKLCEILGYDRADLLRLRSDQVWTDPAARADLIARLRRDGHVTDYEVDVRAAGGAVRTCLASVRLCEDGALEGTVIDITERKIAERERALQGRALEAAADSIAITDERGTILWVNTAFAQHYGYDAGDLVGRTPAVLRSGHHDAAFYADLWGTILDGRTWRGLIVNRRRDGSVCNDETTITPVLDENGRISRFIAVKRDVGRRLELERALRLHQEDLEGLVAERTAALASANQRLEREVAERGAAQAALQASRDLLRLVGDLQAAWIATVDPGKLFAELLQRALDLTSSAFGFVGEIRRNQDGTPYLRSLAVTDIAWNPEMRALVDARGPQGLELRNLRSLIGVTVATGEPVLSADPANDPRRCGLPPGHPPLRSYLGVPIHAGGDLVGMLGLANRPGGYDASLLAHLAPLASTCGLLIAAARAERHRARAEADLQRNLQTQEAIAALLRLALEPLPLPDLAERALAMLMALPWLTLQPRAALFLLDDRSRELVMVAQVGMGTAVRAACARVPLGSCLCGRAAQEGRLIHAAEVGPEHDVRYPGMEPHGHYCVPIRSATRIEGVLCLYLESGHQHSEPEAAFLEAVAATLAGIIARARAEQARRESEAAARAAEESARMRARFLSSMSHELRTPLNAILGFGRLLERSGGPQLEERQRDWLRNVVRSGEHMLALIDDLLDLRRIEDGGVPDGEQRAAVAAGLRQAVAMVQPLASQRGQVIALALDPDLPDVCCSPRALLQVAVNLLSNAIKYTPEGGHVALRAEVRPVGTVRFEVSDDGVGIAPEDQEQLFTYWQQVGGKHAHHMRGSGIGLALCRAQVEQAGGRIAVCSEPGVGSTFSVSLPACSAPAGGGCHDAGR